MLSTSRSQSQDEELCYRLWLSVYALKHCSIFLLPPWQKEVMFLVAVVCLSVCLWTRLLKTLYADLDEIVWRGPGWCYKELIKLWW